MKRHEDKGETLDRSSAERGLPADTDYYHTQSKEQGKLVGIAACDSKIERLSDPEPAARVA